MGEAVQYIRQWIPRGIDFLLALVAALIVFIIGSRLIRKLMQVLKKSLMRREMEPGIVTFLVSAGKIALYGLLVILIAQILGFAASSVVALVGSAGLAIGLALQGSLANFAGGILILFMKPFVVEDYIIVGDVEGTVEKIDVVYTTLHTIDNRAVILPNGKLADSNIINVTKEDKRRIDISVGVEYSEDIRKVRQVLRQIVEKQEARLEDMPVDIVVSALDESAVTMAVHMWVRPEKYWPTRWGMLEEIKEEFEKNGIAIPFRKVDVNCHFSENNSINDL
ncbi:MAG: mechanosensitive ion channel [Lachnospiraceae bacterium]|nr:mechanosensitive ion channel [Lachnospiraceae bacterium]